MTDSFNPNAPVQTLGEAIDMVTSRLAGLEPNVNDDDQKALRKITHLWEKGVREISDGGLTLESCMKMSALLISAENAAKTRIIAGGTKADLNMFEGLKRIHDTMQLISNQQGVNEGNKDCCPYCGGC